MKFIVRIAALLSLCLLPVIASAATPAVETHLAVEGNDAHVHLSLGSRDVGEVQVELFDARGTSIGVYVVRPEEGKSSVAEMSLGFAPEIAAKVASARVTAVSLRASPSGTLETLFNQRLNAVPRSCAGMCNPTRIQCNNNCFCEGCVWATYSCTEASGCQATCVCHDCYNPPEEDDC